jgi:hypothetical protein
VAGAKDFDGNLFIYDEICERKKLPKWFGDELRRRGLFDTRGNQLPVYAPHDAINTTGSSGLSYQSEYLKAGIALQVGNAKPAAVGILRIQRLLKPNMDEFNPYTKRKGRPCLYVFRNCGGLIEELGTYRWKQLRPGEELEKAEPDEVVKVSDDRVDALRYLVMGGNIEYVPEVPREKGVLELELEALRGGVVQEKDWDDY